MGLHLAEISARVAAAAHAVVVLDQAGWHMAGGLAVPPNLSLLPLPAYSPELNPIENGWQFLRHTFLNTRVFADCAAILEACCRAWTALRATPGRLRSITTRGWAKPVSSSDG
jgi:transposase